MPDPDTNVDAHAFWGSIGELWGRATGGSDVAAKPDSRQDDWPTATRPPGVGEAVAWFRSQLQVVGLPKYLFLVGGPGAGKSHAAAELVTDLTEINARSPKLAYRNYQYSTAARNLRLINDATIQDDTREREGLSSDMEDVVREGCDLLACVNRGILVEEAGASSAGQSLHRGAGAETVHWLSRASFDGSLAERDQWSVVTTTIEPYLRAGTLYDGLRPVAQILAIFVDVCSLFEVSPKVTIDQVDQGDFDIEAARYSVQKLDERRIGAAKPSPASSLFAGVLDRLPLPLPLPDDEWEKFDPIVANVRSLASPAIQRGVQSILRAAEIATSQRFTYRELWGAIARCLVGGATEIVNAGDIQDFIGAMKPRATGELARFKEFQKLAQLRFSQSLVGADGANEEDSSKPRNPITRLTRVVDPVRDSIPGFLGQGADAGWATPISDAFAGHVDSGTPLTQLLQGLNEGDPFIRAVTPFDNELDRAFSDAARWQDLKDTDRYAAISWYGAYLMRLYAISNGIPAFYREISMWTHAWFMSPTLPRELNEQLRTLLRPPRFPARGDFDSLIPVFESRTNPIVGEIVTAKLALKTGLVDLKTSTDSDSLFLEVVESNRAVPPMVLDFSLMREAMACGAGHPGTTELSDITNPRLERFRAARLVPGTRLDSTNYRVVQGVGDEPLNVGVH